jgi:hypothetical protein
MGTTFLRPVALCLLTVGFLAAQPVDDTQLKQVIIFGRHSVRSPVAPNSTLNNFSAQPVPDFGVSAPGILTAQGATLETILGGYYRLWLTKEGLLTGNDAVDANFVYFRANVLERTIVTAQRFAAGILPAANINVNFFGPQESDPLFDPMGAGVSRSDPRTIAAAINGRLGGNAQSLASSYASDLALARSILFGYPAGQSPAPDRSNIDRFGRTVGGQCCRRSFHHGVRRWASGFPGWLGPVKRRRHQPDVTLDSPGSRSGVPDALSGCCGRFQSGLACGSLPGSVGHREYHERCAGQSVDEDDRADRFG